MARAQFWTQSVINTPFRTYFRALQEYRLPPPPAVEMLFFATGLLLGIDPSTMKNPCGDIAWDEIKDTTLASLCNDAFTYSCEEKKNVTAESSVAAIRAFCDGANLFDPSTFPPHLQGVIGASVWLQKNLAAREAVVAFHKEVKQEDLEVTV